MKPGLRKEVDKKDSTKVLLLGCYVFVSYANIPVPSYICELIVVYIVVEVCGYCDALLGVLLPVYRSPRLWLRRVSCV